MYVIAGYLKVWPSDMKPQQLYKLNLVGGDFYSDLDLLDVYSIR